MDLERLEEKRRRLESNVEKLRSSLRHWQTWEAEYEGLKEEIMSLSPETSNEELSRIAATYEGDLINITEINTLFGLNKGKSVRNGDQITGVLSRRIEYVQGNIKSIEKQINSKTQELQELDGTQASTQPSSPLALTEIVEQLDEDDNVISGRTMRPGEQTIEVLEMLKKAGMDDKDLPEINRPQGASEDVQATFEQAAKGSLPTENSEGRQAPTENQICASERSDDRPEDAQHDLQKLHRSRKKSVSFAHDTKPESKDPSPTRSTGKKSVSFADGTKPASSGSSRDGPDETSGTQSDSQFAEQPVVGISKLAQENFPSNVRAIELDDEDRPIGINAPSNPIDESAEDAALRRDMEQYAMNEVGSIVAELNLEEGSDSESYMDEDETDEEDDYGLSHGSHLDEEYREKMLELEKKMNATMVQNIGPENLAMNGLAEKKLLSEKEQADMIASRPSSTKDVHFSSQLDIAPSIDEPATDIEMPGGPQSPPITAVQDTIVERKIATAQEQNQAVPPKRVSKFKAARGNMQTPSEAVQPLLGDITERSSTRNPQPPSKPDDFDPEILQREVEKEYYEKRNNMMQMGNLPKRDYIEENDLDDDDVLVDSSGKRVSRFKAARMSAREGL